MAKLPKYFYFRLRPTRKGTAVEIEDASDVDVVEVIRCKDCKLFKTASCAIKVDTDEAMYCSYAERRQDG